MGRDHQVGVVVRVVRNFPDKEPKPPEDEADDDEDQDAGDDRPDDDPPFRKRVWHQLALVRECDGSDGHFVVADILKTGQKYFGANCSSCRST